MSSPGGKENSCRTPKEASPQLNTRAGDPGYLWYFDYDGDGAVDGQDNGQFNRRFGHR